MSVRFASQTEIDKWDDLIITNPDGGDIFQTKEFLQIKQSNNWNPLYVNANNIYISILERKIPSLGNFWYVPKGPGITSTTELDKLLPELRNFAKKHNVFTIKLEPELLNDPDIINHLNKLGLRKSKAVQAANTIIVDISKSMEEITASFSSKTRGNIRAAQKANITTGVVPITDDNCVIFYNMMAKTINGRSHLRKYEYFKKYWQSYYQAGIGLFIFAKSENEIISVDFITIIGTKAARKDAASKRDHPVRGASALLELETIKYLKDKGIKEYDLYGCPPSDQIKNPNHPFYGFGTFKVGFNSHVTDYVGCYDLVLKPLVYKIWEQYGERVARRLHYQKHQDLYY